MTEEIDLSMTVVGDIHLANHAPSGRTDTYGEDILKKLEWTVDYTNKQDVDALWLLGDVFHLKRPDRTSHKMVKRTAEILGESNVPVRITMGNHDMCVPEFVQAFTQEGWKTVDQLTSKDMLATLNKDRQVEWQPLKRIHRSHYKGVGFYCIISGQGISTTPNHKWFATSFRDTTFTMHTSERLFQSGRAYRLPNAMGGPDYSIEPVVIGDKEVDFHDLLVIYSWYVSKGISEDGKVFLGTEVSSNPTELVKVLDKYGFNYIQLESCVDDAPLAEHLEQTFGKEYYGDFDIPDSFLQLPYDSIKHFLENYILAARVKSQGDKPTTICTNRRVAERIRDLSYLSGMTCNVFPEREFVTRDDLRIRWASRIVFDMDNKKRGIKVHPFDMDYGVWCPEVENGVWLARSKTRTTDLVTWTGNSNDRVDSLPQQPLGTLELHPNIEVVFGADKDFPVYSIPYFDITEDNFKYWVDKYHADGGPDKYPVICTHQSIFPEKEYPIYPAITAEMWAEHFKAPYVFYGHIHEPMKAGWNFKVGETFFLNNGSLSRGSLHESSVNRSPQITLFNGRTPDNPFTSIEVPHRPASEVFHLEEFNLSKEQKKSVEAFLDTLKDKDFEFLTTQSILNAAHQEGSLDKHSISILEDIIQEVDSK